jgi:membrane-associated protein
MLFMSGYEPAMILLFQSAEIIEWGGILIIAILIFAETGLLLGLVVPGGETLVFTAGLLVSTGTLHIHAALLLGILVLCGLAGDISGFYMGKKLGRKLHHRKDTWYFRKKYLYLTEDFIQRHRRRSIIIGKFLPIIRPFMPFISGTTDIRPAVFVSLSALAVALYMSAFLLTGYFLGDRFPQIKNYLGWIIPISIIIALIPVIQQVRKAKAKS